MGYKAETIHSSLSTKSSFNSSCQPYKTSLLFVEHTKVVTICDAKNHCNQIDTYQSQTKNFVPDMINTIQSVAFALDET